MKEIIPLLLAITVSAYGQTFAVNGTVSTSTSPVRFATVTFMDVNDTTRKFSTLTDTSGRYHLDIITSVKPHENLPTKFALEQNYPNPFSSSTSISYKLAEQSNISVRIYNVLGQLVRKFDMGAQSAGVHGIVWDGTNNFGRRVAPGVYFYQLITGNKSQAKKMLFGFGGNGTATLFQATAGLPDRQLKTMNTSRVETEYYAVQIEGSDNTQPRIFLENYYYLIIRSDTTLNFRVAQVVDDHHTLWVVGYDSSVTALAMKSTDGGLSWQRVLVTEAPPEEFWDVAFADSLHGWVVGDYRHIWHTGDGGLSWQLQFSSNPVTDTIGDACVSIAAVDSLHALAVTSGGAILRTTDGGKSWQEKRSADRSWIRGLAYVDSLTAYVVLESPSFYDKILKTEDGGETWYPTLSDSLLRIDGGIQFFNRDTGWICGEKSKTPLSGPWDAFVAYTLDGGKNWNLKYIIYISEYNINVDFDAGPMWFFDLDTGVAVIDYRGINRTTDGGDTWSGSEGDIDPNIAGVFNKLKFSDPSTGWAVGSFAYGGGIIGKTNDGGISWFYQSTGYPGPCTFSGLCVIK